MYRNWYKRHRHNQDEHGHYERRRDGEPWTTCTSRDARMALGFATAEELRREAGPARSEWGVAYRYVWNVSAEAKRAG